MEALTPAAARALLLERPRTAKLATGRADGRPHVAPVWFDLDGADLLFITWHTTVKATNLRYDPRVSLCVDDEAPPFAFVIVVGLATLSEDVAELRRWATRIAARCMGDEQAVAYGERNGVAGEILVRVSPTKIIGQASIAA